MVCTKIKNNKFWAAMFIFGMICLVFGVVGYTTLTSLSSSGNTLMGMFSGFGGTFVLIGALRMIYNKKATPEKLKVEEINLKDERNIQLRRMAYSTASIASTILFAIMTFVFVILDYITPAFITVGVLIVQLVVFLAAYKYYSTRM